MLGLTPGEPGEGLTIANHEPGLPRASDPNTEAGAKGVCRSAPDGLLCVPLLRRSRSPRPSSLVSGTPTPTVLIETPRRVSECSRGTWVPQPVERLTLDFGSGHDLPVRGMESCVGPCAECGACLGLSLSPSLPLPL